MGVQGRHAHPFQGRIAYRGPLGVPTFPRVLLDITRHEAILGAPVERAGFHPYPWDCPGRRGYLVDIEWG